jgi:CPA2 family monovalent cation:H+ antiporter-2/trk system potassium uptake protein TrkA
MGVPVIILEVVAGILIGKSFLNVVVLDPWLEFLAYFGLVYLLFLAGLEMGIREFHLRSLSIAMASLTFPFVLGGMLGITVGVAPLFLGAILSTTSVGVVLPTLKEVGGRKAFRRVVLESALLVDAFSMFLLAISVEVMRGTPTSLVILSLLFALSLFPLPIVVRVLHIGSRLAEWAKDKPHFEYEVRFCLAIIVFLAVIFEIVGFHAILGSFLAGLVISELTEKGSLLERRLMGFGYGFFIPLFFVTLGASANIPALLEVQWLSFLLLLAVLGVVGKAIGVAGMGKALGFSREESWAMGFLHAARLSLILAGAKIGLDLGILNEAAYSAIILFAIGTVLVCPSISKAIVGREGKLP